LHQQLQQLRLYIAFAVVAFFIIIAVTKFKATVVVKKLAPDFRKFFSLNLVYYFQLQNFNLGPTNSSLLYLIVIVLSSRHFLYFIGSGFSIIQQLNFKLLFLNFADFVVGQVLINFGLLANRFHLQLAFHFHRKLGMDKTMDSFQRFVSSWPLLQRRKHFKTV